MPDPSDKRTSPRIPFVLRVSYADRQSLADATENLSTGGLFIQTTQRFEVGQPIPLKLSFPGLLQPIEVTGVVTWSRPQGPDAEAGIGVRVDHPAEQAKLKTLLSPEPSPEPAPAPTGPYRVLVVEDNPHVAEMYGYALKKLSSSLKGKAGLEVAFATDGHGALQSLAEKPTHLVITDLYMPVLDGFVLVQKMKAEPTLAKIPVVAISAGGPEAQLKASNAGVDLFLRKPVRFVEVLETVKKLLRLE
jgi:uncharacterized protein (TIGR02266 family)